MTLSLLGEQEVATFMLFLCLPYLKLLYVLCLFWSKLVSPSYVVKMMLFIWYTEWNIIMALVPDEQQVRFNCCVLNFEPFYCVREVILLSFSLFSNVLLSFLNLSLFVY